MRIRVNALPMLISRDVLRRSLRFRIYSKSVLLLSTIYSSPSFSIISDIFVSFRILLRVSVAFGSAIGGAVAVTRWDASPWPSSLRSFLAILTSLVVI